MVVVEKSEHEAARHGRHAEGKHKDVPRPSAAVKVRPQQDCGEEEGACTDQRSGLVGEEAGNGFVPPLLRKQTASQPRIEAPSDHRERTVSLDSTAATMVANEAKASMPEKARAMVKQGFERNTRERRVQPFLNMICGGRAEFGGR